MCRAHAHGVAVPAAAPQPAPAQGGHGKGQGQGLVLVVDDVALNRVLLSTLARKLGFSTVEAADGAQAVALFARLRGRLACVLLDLQMPVLDGWATARQLRSLEAAAPPGAPVVPIIACTACDLEAAVAAGGLQQLPPADERDGQRRRQPARGAGGARPAGELSVEARTLACGVDLCLNKPMTLVQLRDALQQLSVACPATA